MGRNYLISAMFLGLLTITVPALGAPEAAPPPTNPDDARIQELTRVCAKLECRKSARNLSLRSADGKTVEASTEHYPYVDDHGDIVIYPDETIGVAVAKQNDSLGLPVLASVTDRGEPVKLAFPQPAEANLSFEFRQHPDNPSMILKIDNRIDAAVKFDLVMFISTAKGYRAVPTSSCTLMPPQGSNKSFMGFESWPQPILMMVISHIRMVPKSATIDCR